MKVAIYATDTGKIKRWISCPAYMVDLQIREGEEFFLNCPPEATHIINNEPVTIIPEPVLPTEKEIIASLTKAVQDNLDSIAQQRGYDGILSLCSYTASTDPVFKAEGQVGIEWRDACWRRSYEIMGEVQIGSRVIPSSKELIALLPEIVWP